MKLRLIMGGIALHHPIYRRLFLAAKEQLSELSGMTFEQSVHIINDGLSAIVPAGYRWKMTNYSFSIFAEDEKSKALICFLEKPQFYCQNYDRNKDDFTVPPATGAIGISCINPCEYCNSI